MSKVLPDLRNRDEIQAYLASVAQEVGGALDSSEVAAELDRRDELAPFRKMFHYPTIGEFLEEEERDPGNIDCRGGGPCSMERPEGQGGRGQCAPPPFLLPIS